MSILFADNYSNYGSGSTGRTHMKEGVYAQSNGFIWPTTDPDGVSGGLVLATLDSGQEYFRKVLPQGAQTTLGFASRMYLDELAADSPSTGFLRFMDVDNEMQVWFRFGTTGILSVYRGDGTSNLLGSTATPVIVAGSWFHFETKVVFDNAAGSVEVRINEETVLDLTGKDTVATANVEASQYWLAPANTVDVTYFKDTVVWNDGGSENNDFLGDCEVVSLYVTGDDTFTGWSSTAANGYSVLDETTPSDSDYITADATDTTAAVFTLSDLDPDVTTVKGLLTFTRALKTDSGTANVQTGLNSNGDLDLGTDNAVSTSATYYVDVSELDPDTASAWTPTTVNAAKLVIDRTA